MKLKRFMAIVISLAMVLSIVPAFSLTASAAPKYGVTELINMSDYSFIGDNLGGSWRGWPWANVPSTSNWYGWGGACQLYSISNSDTIIDSHNGDGVIYANDAVHAGTQGKDFFILTWVAEGSGAAEDFKILTGDGTTAIDTFRFRASNGEGLNYQWANNGWNNKFPGVATNYTYEDANGGVNGSATSNTQYYIVYENDEDGEGYTASYYFGSTPTRIGTKTFATGTVNGFYGFEIQRVMGEWSRMHQVKIYAGNYPAAAVEVTATYTVNGETVKTVNKTYDSSAATGASFDDCYVYANNDVYYATARTLSENTTIEMTRSVPYASRAIGEAFTFDGMPYKVAGESVIKNGNFATGDTSAWTNRADGTITGATVAYDSEVGGNALKISTGGASYTNSIGTKWNVEVGKTYYLSFYVGGQQPGSDNYRYNRVFYGDGETELVAYGANMNNNAWKRFEKVFTATQDIVLFQGSWAENIKYANVELVPVELDESKIANTTIKFVDSSDNSTEIKEAVTVKGIVGDVITIADHAPATITYNSNPYSLDSTNPETYTVVGNSDVVTLTYTTDAFVKFTAEPVKVIKGNTPVMPTTVTAVTGTGAETVASGAVWTGYENLAVGTHTVTGTVSVDGVEVSGSTTVTVLDETFSLADTDVPASSDKTLTFPEKISGEFTIEFDYTPSDVHNNWIYISADGALWGAGQVGLGTDNDNGGHLKAQPSTYLGYVESGKTYRVLITASAETDTYSIVVTSEDGTQWKADSTFRAGSDYINSIRMTPNGNAGAFAVKNIKVNNANSTLKTITINATGSVNETTTAKASSAETAPIPYYEGNVMKSRSISGNTVTLVYEETVATTGSWYMRNNFRNENWLTESKYIGSHDAFADTDKVFDNEGGDLYGDDFTTSSSSTVVNNSRAQSVGVVDQLNAGVRYFDVRLSRQKDGSFATVHGPAFENFRDVATSMAQWAKENAGEVIILDFQVVRDALYTSDKVVTNNTSKYGPDKGDDNADVYAALVQLFKDTGLSEFMTTNWDKKYGEITNNGEKAVILPFGKARAVNCEGGSFINRSHLNNDVTYKESNSYSTVAKYLDDTYANLPNGATICTIHAYTTPTGLNTLSGNLLSDAKTNNTKWINEANFENWMASGKGDVLLLNDSVSNIDVYYAKLNTFNRSGSFSADFEREENGVAIKAPQASIPFSTKYTVEKNDNAQSVVVDDTNCTTKSVYSVNLMQFNENSVEPTGNVTLTFPKASTDNTTVDVLIYNNHIVATANVGEAISYTTSTLGNFILATKTAPGVELTVKYVAGGEVIYTNTTEYAYGVEAYNVPAGNFYIVLDGKAYILNSSEAKSYTISESDTAGSEITLELNMVSKYAVLEDALADSDAESKIWGVNKTNNNSIFVAAAGEKRNGPEFDADGVAVTDGEHTPSRLGSNRNGYLQFPVVKLADGQAALAKFYVRTWHGNTFSNGNTSIRLSATAINDDSWTKLTDGQVYDDTKSPKFEGFTSVMFSDVATNTPGYITFDVTEMMKAADEAGLSTITMRLATSWGAAYIAEREACVAGGEYQGNAAYIDVVDANMVTVPAGATKVTKNGTDVTAFANAHEGVIAVPANETIKITMSEPETGKVSDKVMIYVDENGNIYEAGSAFAPTGEVTPYTFGLDMVTGAQVRIGNGVDENGKVTADSGLRFIVKVSRDGSMASLDNAKMGVLVSAEGSTDVLDIPAEKWQDEDQTIFTAALTNLLVTNYNRKFTATPYVTVGEKTFTGTPITRSIYQVAAGLLTEKYTDGTDYDEGALADGSRLYAVLNAYVNQTGIRLQVNSDKTGLEIYNKENSMATYTGNAFFSVESTSVDNGVYSITIKPVGEKTEIKSYWKEYIRINNNNSMIAPYTDLADNGDGTVTITFDYAQYVADNA